MRFDRTDSFKRDYKRLSEEERDLFREAVLDEGGFHDAAEAFVSTKNPGSWPARLRVKPMVGAPGIFEMTWSFSGPDGRATFQWTEIEGEPAILWRRIGGHDIFRKP